VSTSAETPLNLDSTTVVGKDDNITGAIKAITELNQVPAESKSASGDGNAIVSPTETGGNKKKVSNGVRQADATKKSEQPQKPSGTKTRRTRSQRIQFYATIRKFVNATRDELSAVAEFSTTEEAVSEIIARRRDSVVALLRKHQVDFKRIPADNDCLATLMDPTATGKGACIAEIIVKHSRSRNIAETALSAIGEVEPLLSDEEKNAVVAQVIDKLASDKHKTDHAAAYGKVLAQLAKKNQKNSNPRLGRRTPKRTAPAVPVPTEVNSYVRVSPAQMIVEALEELYSRIQSGEISFVVEAGQQLDVGLIVRDYLEQKYGSDWVNEHSELIRNAVAALVEIFETSGMPAPIQEPIAEAGAMI